MQLFSLLWFSLNEHCKQQIQDSLSIKNTLAAGRTRPEIHFLLSTLPLMFLIHYEANVPPPQKKNFRIQFYTLNPWVRNRYFPNSIQRFILAKKQWTSNFWKWLQKEGCKPFVLKGTLSPSFQQQPLCEEQLYGALVEDLKSSLCPERNYETNLLTGSSFCYDRWLHF